MNKPYVKKYSEMNKMGFKTLLNPITKQKPFLHKYENSRSKKNKLKAFLDKTVIQLSDYYSQIERFKKLKKDNKIIYKKGRNKYGIPRFSLK